MTQPLYTQQALEALECKEVKVIARNLGITPEFRKVKVIAQIISFQKEQIRQVEAPAPQVSHCRQCPFFSANHPGSERGWCHAFNSRAYGFHQATDGCQLEIAAQVPEVPPADPQEMPAEIEVNGHTLTKGFEDSAGAIYQTIAYHSIEYVKDGGYWYCGDGVKYPEPSQALTAVLTVWDGMEPVGLEDLPTEKELVFAGCQDLEF